MNICIYSTQMSIYCLHVYTTDEFNSKTQTDSQISNYSSSYYNNIKILKKQSASNLFYLL